MKCWCLKDQSVVHFKIPFHGTLHSSKSAEWIQCECAIFSHCSTTLARKLWTNNGHVCFSRCCSLSFFVLICLWDRTIPTSQKRKRRHVKAKPINTGSIFPNRVQLHWVFGGFLSMGERCLKIVSSSWERHRCHSFFFFSFLQLPMKLLPAHNLGCFSPMWPLGLSFHGNACSFSLSGHLKGRSESMGIVLFLWFPDNSP